MRIGQEIFEKLSKIINKYFITYFSSEIEKENDL